MINAHYEANRLHGWGAIKYNFQNTANRNGQNGARYAPKDTKTDQNEDGEKRIERYLRADHPGFEDVVLDDLRHCHRTEDAQ